MQRAIVLYEFDSADQFVQEYRYDADNRLTEVLTSSDRFTWHKEAHYFYYAHGPLARIELGEHRVQGLDYYYTLQGWLKGVNGTTSSNDPGGDGLGTSLVGKDAFSFALGYHEGDYQGIGATPTTHQLWDRLQEQQGHTGLYNGNISWMQTSLPGLKQQGLQSEQAMLYEYDQLNRLVQAQSLRNFSEESGFAARDNSPKAFDAAYSYDANGNLLTLERRDQQAALMDAFAYQYQTATNRLSQVSDTGTEPDNSRFAYDKIGNLTQDSGEGTSIDWTPYGKPRTVTKTDGTIVNYRYDAAGNRVEKQVVSSDTSYVTRYIRDASGNVLAIYENDSLTEQPIYGSSRLGVYRGGSEAGEGQYGNRRFELSNHLGNVLSVITDNVNMNQDSTWATIVSAQDAFPFGLEMKGRGWQSENYRTDFNGKETDTETGMQNYGMRMYLKKYNRFASVDPLARNFPWNSTYAFAENDVIRSIDLDGLEKVVIIGGADLFSEKNSTGNGLSKTAVDIRSSVQNYYEANNLNPEKVKAINYEYINNWALHMAGNLSGREDGELVDDAYNEFLSHIAKDFDSDEKLIVYGYSKGGERALKWIKENKNITIDLLILIDAADGWQSDEIDSNIPGNVKNVINLYQETAKSLPSLPSRGKAVSAESNSTNIIVNKSLSGQYFENKNGEIKGIDHSNIDEATKNGAVRAIVNEVGNGSKR